MMTEMNDFWPQPSKLGKIKLMPNSVTKQILTFLVVFVAIFQGVSAAHAEKAKKRHVFVVTTIDLPTGAPATLEALLHRQIGKTIEAEPQLLGALPEGAPPVDESDKGLQGNTAFRKFMKKKNLKAYKVTAQVTSFEQTSAPNTKKPGNIIGCSIKLRMFGETIPDRVMAFSGDGSASVALEVGKKIRERDTEFAINDALELSINDAVATSLKKLNAKSAAAKKKRRRKK